MSADLNPHSLTYAAPRVLLERVSRHRTSRRIGAMVFCSIAAAYLLIFPGRTQPDYVLRMFARGIGSVFLICGLIEAYCWIWGEDEIIRITEDGIEQGAKMWRWRQIYYFGAELRFSAGDEVIVSFCGK